VCALALQEQDLPERNLILRDSRSQEELLRFSEAALEWFSFPLEHLKICEQMLSRKSCYKEYPRKWSEAALARSYLLLEHLKIREKHALRDILLLGEIYRLKRTWTDAIFNKFKTKTILNLKINLIWKTSNFVSIQLNYLKTSQISWDYPFKAYGSVCNYQNY
jgi:hypothetical protein